MAAAASAFELSGAERLARALAARQRELGETSRQSCVAIAVQALRGMRTRTRIADERRNRVTAAVSSLYVAFDPKRGNGFIVDGRGRPVRLKRGGLIWAEKPASRNHGLRVYRAQNVVNAAEGKVFECHVVAKSRADAVAAVRERVKRRVAARKGLARLALGFCMHDLAVRTGLGAADAPGRVTLTARTAAKADIIETGFSSGETAVRIADRLRYAAKALKGGRAAIAEALDAALNKTRGLIVSRLKKDGRMEDAIAVKGMF